MANLKTINVTHEKIGEIILPVDQNGKPKYDKQTIESILLSGVSTLNQNKVISDSDNELLASKIKEAKIVIIENLGSRIAYNHNYHRLTGEPLDLSVSFDETNSLLDVNDTINSLLSILCDITLSVLHPESNIKRAAGDDYKGSDWEKYAFSILPEERATNEIIAGKLRKTALDYFAEHVNPKLCELLAEEYGGDWADFLADDYASIVVSDLNDIEIFKNGDYMDVKGYIGDIICNNGREESLS